MSKYPPQNYTKEWSDTPDQSDFDIGVLTEGLERPCQSSYMLITLLNTLSKIVEETILIRTKRHLTDYNIIPNLQYGFRKCHSTVHPFNQCKYTGVIFIDGEKAFNSILTENSYINS